MRCNVISIPGSACTLEAVPGEAQCAIHLAVIRKAAEEQGELEALRRENATLKATLALATKGLEIAVSRAEQAQKAASEAQAMVQTLLSERVGRPAGGEA
jgi:hypothetical protein